MARKKADSSKPIEQYEHKDKERLNNPPVGLVDAHTDNGGQKKKQYSYDPHLDPQLQWAGKAEHTCFEVPTVSLHVHERIDPRRIIESVRKEETGLLQPSLFEETKKPLREAIEFYKHKENWSNRLIAGDSLLIMNSLLEKEGMGGKVQMVYFDPPYGIKYGSNFQPFVNKRDVKDGKDEDLTAEPEMIKAFRDTWELGIHSYLTYLRDRLLLARDLLDESGSVFVQISDENVHHVREIMDEVFGRENFVSQIAFQTTPYATSNFLAPVYDIILWYAKDIKLLKYRALFLEKEKLGKIDLYKYIEAPDGTYFRTLTYEELENPTLIPKDWKRFQSVSLISQGKTSTNQSVEFEGKTWVPPVNNHWKVTVDGLKNAIKQNRFFTTENSLRFKSFLTDFPITIIHNIWNDMITGSFTDTKKYVVQTNPKVIQRCLLMTTDPGDLVLDITCGSGTTAYVAESWGRRWITCDTSRVAIALAKQRLMTANFDYYELAYPNEGVGSGFKYKTVPHITLKSIANNDPPSQETLYDQPFTDRKRQRVTEPFTVEAVPAPIAVMSGEELSTIHQPLSTSIARSGETLRQSEWKDELLRAGVRAKGGKLIEFTRVETLSGTRYLQAEAETKENSPKRVLVSFGPEHAPLEQRMVELALEEAGHMRPKPDMILFCAFQFDEEASKDIDETNWPGVTLLKAQMNADLMTDDLKKKRSSNESFWLIGQPDVQLIKQSDGKYVVEVLGFDYYNPKTGTVESGSKGDIAMWMLDTDYDGRSLFPSQVFFPMAGAKEGWASLAKNLKAEIDEEKIEAFNGTSSLPFTPDKAVAV
ncbi:MAG TPA: site-specific DNA-methyltransferase [Lentisphaeria bacterium]|nr:MAG: DNA methylase [Lentisphaerae bacterium GWF2_38_69]HBM16539.1 site-specific DNA-methyltransferase [Lentisphaeria bacterium]